MSDVRTLLKAKRQEIRVNHPLACYTSSGQLRCVVCETNIKHPSAWDGHLGSKVHRTNAARLRTEEKQRKELELEEGAKRVKRKVPKDDVGMDVDSPAKKSRLTAAPQSQGEAGETAVVVKLQDSAVDSTLDQEWIRFQRSLIEAPDSRTTYDHATVFAEPELVSGSPEGFPTHGTNAEPIAKLDEDERRRKEQEERELIMDRLMDEERAQEEADMKVTIMKTKLEALRKRREASRSAKSNLGDS